MSQTKLVVLGVSAARQIQGMTDGSADSLDGTTIIYHCHERSVCAKQCECSYSLVDHKQAREFLNTLTEKVNKDETRDAYVLAKMETTHFGLLLGDMDTTKKDLEECAKYLDRFESVDPQINASYLRVSSDYYKVKQRRADTLLVCNVTADDLRRRGLLSDPSCFEVMGKLTIEHFVWTLIDQG